MPSPSSAHEFRAKFANASSISSATNQLHALQQTKGLPSLSFEREAVSVAVEKMAAVCALAHQPLLAPLARAERQFTGFPKLPKELQLEIWEASLPGPRVVKLRYRGEGADAKCTSRARIPIALHVCRDSREVAKEVYKLSFGLKGFSQPGGSSWKVGPKIYFSFDRDTLFIDTEGFRPCDSLRGMSFEMLRAEAHRFHCLAKQVQDLAKVRKLAAWEYLPMVAVHGVSFGDSGEVRNPWSAFEGIEGEVMGVGVASQVYDKDLTVKEPNPLDGVEWDLEQDVNLITRLKWKPTWLVARSPSAIFLGYLLETTSPDY